jgi:hypothetical protein
MFRAAPDTYNLDKCVEDVTKAWKETTGEPKDILDFIELKRRLNDVKKTFKSPYLEQVFTPFMYILETNVKNRAGYNQLLNDRDRADEARATRDIAQAILQRGGDYNGMDFPKDATEAFQEVVSDLYDGFLSAEDRRGVKPPDYEKIPPLVNWGWDPYPKEGQEGQKGPYTITAENTNRWFGDQSNIGIVTLPPVFAQQCLLAWVVLGHETTGHDILHADVGLLVGDTGEMRLAVAAALGDPKEKIPKDLCNYWITTIDVDRLDEIAADILGILNMGPAAAMGGLCYLRGWNDAFFPKKDGPHLSCIGERNTPHPAQILRGYVAEKTVRSLKFKGAAAWAEVLKDKIKEDEDYRQVSENGFTLDGQIFSPKDARRSAEIVADTLINHKFNELQGLALSEIQNWRDSDEDIAKEIRAVLVSGAPVSKDTVRPCIAKGLYAAHVVAAAVTTAISSQGVDKLDDLFKNMLQVLKYMYGESPPWRPWYVRHRRGGVPGVVT